MKCTMLRVHQVFKVILVPQDLMEAKEKLVHLAHRYISHLILLCVMYTLSTLSLYGLKLKCFWSMLYIHEMAYGYCVLLHAHGFTDVYKTYFRCDIHVYSIS